MEEPTSPLERPTELRQLPPDHQDQVLQIGDGLRAARETKSPEQFTEWAAGELRMDEATTQDFLTIEATGQLTPRIWQYLEQMAQSDT